MLSVFAMILHDIEETTNHRQDMIMRAAQFVPRRLARFAKPVEQSGLGRIPR